MTKEQISGLQTDVLGRLKDKVEDLFIEFQQVLGVKYGDVDPLECLRLHFGEEPLAWFITDILVRQKGEHMNKYYNVDQDEVITEDELRESYKELKRSGDLDPAIYDTFEYYLEACMTRNNGSLDLIAPDGDIERKRRQTAERVADMTGYNYADVLGVLQRLGVHSTWTVEALRYRPVDYDELAEIVSEELG